MVDRMRDGLYMVEGERFVFVNPALANLVGHAVNDLIGQHYRTIVAPSSLPAVDEHYKRRRAGLNAPSSYETRYLHKDGVTEIPVIMNVDLATLEDGRIVTIGTVTDITDRIRVEDALRASERQLSEAQRIGRIGHWRLDAKTDEIECSDIFREIYGWDSAGIASTLTNATAAIHPDDREQLNAIRDSAIRERRPYKFVVRIIRPDGEIRFLRGEGQPAYDENGQYLSVFGVSQDITEQRQIEQELLRERLRAENANNAKSEFLASISHEIRTPLNAILGFAGIMDDKILGPIGNEKYAEYVGDIRTSATHLLDLVNDILNVSTIEAGEFSLSRSKFKLDDVSRECLKIIRAQARDAGVELVANLPKNLPPLHADRRAVVQIMINLLANAVKFTPDGGRVEIDISATSDAFLISITDTGIGIPEDALPDITLPFDRGRQNPHESKEGSGLGLAIVNSLVAMHDGKIESVVGAGTRVRVWLPLDNRAAA